MNYSGKLYGKIGRRYVPLKMTSEDVDGLLALVNPVWVDLPTEPGLYVKVFQHEPDCFYPLKVTLMEAAHYREHGDFRGMGVVIKYLRLPDLVGPASWDVQPKQEGGPC